MDFLNSNGKKLGKVSNFSMCKRKLYIVWNYMAPKEKLKTSSLSKPQTHA